MKQISDSPATTPSRPAVNVPMIFSLFLFYPQGYAPSPRRRTSGQGREPDRHAVPLDPELFLLVGPEIDCQNHARAARPAPRNTKVADVRVRTLRTPVLHE